MLEIIIILFALFAFSRVLLKFKDKAIGWTEFLFWTIIWLLLIAVTLLRRKLGFLGEISGMGDPFKVIVILSVVLLFYLVFKLYLMLDNSEQQITKLVREVAIKRKKK